MCVGWCSQYVHRIHASACRLCVCRRRLFIGVHTKVRKAKQKLFKAMERERLCMIQRGKESFFILYWRLADPHPLLKANVLLEVSSCFSSTLSPKCLLVGSCLITLDVLTIWSILRLDIRDHNTNHRQQTQFFKQKPALLKTGHCVL